MRSWVFFIFIWLVSAPSFAIEVYHPAMAVSAECDEMQVKDDLTGMCLPLPMPGMPMTMLMFHGNAFLTEDFESGPRGSNELTLPNMFMLDAGKTIGERQYLNLQWMGTIERWTFPAGGYPEFLQIGEENADHQPYLDAQHPHSSPIMGLSLSDTISLAHEKNYFKFWFAPRGASTDGPIAFMHRPTAVMNPDAPLGHHIGQDAGHVSSTVLGGILHLHETSLELSGFNGQEPEPSQIDLPLGVINSYAARLTEHWSNDFFTMMSVAFVKNPESQESDLDHVWRYSLSGYANLHMPNGWMFHNSFIWGLITGYDHAAALNSLSEEFLFHKNRQSVWGRIEVLQRTPAELQGAASASQSDDAQWVSAFTLGFTQEIANFEESALGVGASLTQDILPSSYQAAYSGNPVSAKVFLQASGMKMWDF